MVVIRLSRTGAKKRPFFNVVVIDSRSRRDGKFIEYLGFYNPKAGQNDEHLRIDLPRIVFWTERGAQISGTVKRLVRQFKKIPSKPVTQAVELENTEEIPQESAVNP